MGKKNLTSIYIGLASILFSNAVVVYGVTSLNWNFFMVIYAYWFGEVISSLFDKIKVRTLKSRNELPARIEPEENVGRFFFLFIYWVFIVVIAGFVTAPEKTYIENILVILFLNKFFDISILFVLLGEFAMYWNSFFIEKNYNPQTIVANNSMMNKKTIIMHISIIFGAFAWFALNTDKFFFHIDAGEFGSYGFMIVFVVIRLVGDLMGLRSDFSKNNITNINGQS
jgi:hypothetical protein